MTALRTLRPEQADAAAPADNVWVSAAAGTGKTQVLTARVLRLLLGGARPDAILCLTFTRAAAAEMQSRILGVLARWARADDAALDSDFAALHVRDFPPRARARALFAHVLETAGGLRVSTLHAFAQSLLASFPIEAGLTPGFAALDDREARALRDRVLADAIDDAARDGDTGFADDLAHLSVASGEGRLDAAAGLMLRHGEAIAALGVPAGFEPMLRRVFGAPPEGDARFLLAAAIQRLDHAELRAFANHCGGHTGIKAQARADRLHHWLTLDEDERVARFDELCAVLFTQKGTPHLDLVPGGKKADMDMKARCKILCDAIEVIVGEQRTLTAATLAARHLRIGARLAAAHARAKTRLGVIDYDDMVAKAASLLRSAGMADWVRFKLDQRIDHLLIDEAQDTSAGQWDIAEALSAEFFDGEGARPEVQRTLFVVGDFKQAIMSFQGAEPALFRDRREHFAERAQSGDRPWHETNLSESFRSVPAVLDVVDAFIDTVGHDRLGLADAPPAHRAARRDLAGSVTLWPPLAIGEVDDGEDAGDTLAEESSWLAPGDVRMARDLATTIAGWLSPETPLRLEARGRAVRPEDILVLVRNRGEFMGALVAALHEAGVPVAGADRMRLAQPLAVQDLLALIRFVLQPGDDLSLAALLVSPLGDLVEADLFPLAHGRDGTLWRRLRDSSAHAGVRDRLQAALALADFAPPYEFLEAMLTTYGGRHRLLARLGPEANDAIDALLAQALLYEKAAAPSLEGFLAWVAAEGVDVKRDPDAPLDAVRIMTAHGAKGLQAPVVVLADATRKPTADTDSMVLYDIAGNGQPVPVFFGSKAGRVGRIEAAAEDADRQREQEHHRLLYVALTRAEDHLFIGGALGVRDKKGPHPSSWWCKLDATFDKLGVAPDPTGARVHASGGPGPAEPRAAPTAPHTASRLAWTGLPPAPDPLPPRPLRPSALPPDAAEPPPQATPARAAARRGQLTHALFERLPALDPAARAAAATSWLARHAPELDPEARAAISDEVLGILADPRFAGLFSPAALAEAPLAAVVGDAVIAGTIDRLLVTADAVSFVDFKTGRRAPATLAAVPPAHLRQMSAYAAALARIFPHRPITAALLYTETATLIELPATVLASGF